MLKYMYIGLFKFCTAIPFQKPSSQGSRAQKSFRQDVYVYLRSCAVNIRDISLNLFIFKGLLECPIILPQGTGLAVAQSCYPLADAKAVSYGFFPKLS